MFKRLYPFLFVVFFFLLTVDSYASYDQKIEKYTVNIEVNEDASIDVVEKILMDFGSNERHGIIRSIPFAYGEGAEYIELDLEVLEIFDENSEPYQYDEYKNYYNWNLKIGDPDETITGKHWYYISYHVDNVITGFETHDEFYWNVTGSEWDFPIEFVEVFLTLPEGASLSSNYLDCYTGIYYSSQQNCFYSDLGDNTYYFVTKDSLSFRENLTILASIENGRYFQHIKGVIEVPAILQLSVEFEDYVYSGANVSMNDLNYRNIYSRTFRLRPGKYDLEVDKFKYKAYSESFDLGSGERKHLNIVLKASYVKKIMEFYLPISLFLFFAFAIFLYWWKYGKDPEGKGVIMPIYKVPKNLKPGELGVLIDEKAHMHDITATIIDLAVKGYLKIKQKKTKGMLWGYNYSYTFIKLKSGGGLSGYEKKIYDAVFSAKSNEVSLEYLKEKFYKNLPGIKSKLYSKVVRLGLFEKNPDNVRKDFSNIGCAISFLLTIPFIILAVFMDSPYYFLMILIAVGLIFVSKIMPKKTRKGVEVYEQVLGYKMFLKATEQDRLKTLYSPKDYKDVFQKHLPYAIVMGVEESWIEHFDGLFKGKLDWYKSSGAFNMSGLSSGLHSFNNMAEKTFLSKPSSASGSYTSGWGGSSWSGGSSSGFGGGGFSGGGFGGGGGSSW